MSRLHFGSMVDLFHDTILSHYTLTQIISWLVTLPLTEAEMMDDFQKYKVWYDDGPVSYINVIHKTEKKGENGQPQSDDAVTDSEGSKAKKGTDNNEAAITHYRSQGRDNKTVPLEFQHYFTNDRVAFAASKMMRFLQDIKPTRMAISDLLYQARHLVEGDYHISPPNRNILLEKLPAPANYADLKAVTANQIAAGLTLMLFEAVRTDIKKDYNEVCYHHLGAEGFFVGRDSELNQIADYFSNNGRVLVLYGLDGMGKSALARHYAWRATLSYDIVWWINASTKQSVLESYSTFLDQLPAISKTLGKKKKIEDFQDSGLLLVERFQKALSLATASWLLIYDNLSYDTKSERAWLQEILPAEGNGRILVTTHTHREYDGTGRIKVDPLDENSAVNLLSCKLREWDKDNVQALAKRLHCFPLAFALVGEIISTTPGYTAQKCMNDLERHGLVCLDDGLEETEYHQSILAIIRTLYDKIKEDRQHDQCSCVVEPLLLCCALGAPYDINIWNFHKMLHFQHSTWTNGKVKYADSSSGNDENVKLEDLPSDQRLKVLDPTLYQSLLQLETVSNNSMTANTLGRIVLRYGLLEEQQNGLLCMNPLIQQALFDSMEPLTADALIGVQNAAYSYMDDLADVIDIIDRKQADENNLDYEMQPGFYSYDIHKGYLLMREAALAKRANRPLWEIMRLYVKKEANICLSMTLSYQDSAGRLLSARSNTAPQDTLTAELRSYSDSLRDLMDSFTLRQVNDTTMNLLCDVFNEYLYLMAENMETLSIRWKRLHAIELVKMMVDTLQFLVLDFLEYMPEDARRTIWQAIRGNYRKGMGSVVPECMEFDIGNSFDDTLMDYADILRHFELPMYEDGARISANFQKAIANWKEYRSKEKLYPLNISVLEYEARVHMANQAQDMPGGNNPEFS